MNKSIVYGAAALAGLALLVITARQASTQVGGSLPAFLKLQATTPGTQQTGNANVSGTAIAGQFQGGGSGLTSLNASNLATGMLADARLSANVPLLDASNVFTAGPNTFGGSVAMDGFQLGSAANAGDVLTSDASGVGTWQAPTGSSVWGSIGNDVFSTNAGNVGIGTTAPLAKLDIALSGPGAELLRFSTERPWVFRQTLTGPSAGLELFSTVGGKNFQITSSGGTNVATFFADDANPRVGIGTNAPAATLHSVTGSASQISIRGRASGADGIGVLGEASTTNGYTYGVFGQTYSTSGVGGAGYARAESGVTYGVFGSSNSTEGVGVFGYAYPASGTTYGTYGQSNSASGWGVWAQGRFGASGTKSFRIDHPLDPENKYLLHYSTEMPEPQNAYNGVVTTDAQGVAWIQLPDYFEEINKDFRYTLTVVDDTDRSDFVMAQVTRKIRDNRFKIRTSAPNVEVSWEVKGVRNDLWVRKNGAPVEVEKEGKEKGKYQHPELYGLGPERGMRYDVTRTQYHGENKISRP